MVKGAEQNKCILWVRTERKPGFTLKHPDRRNRVGHTGGINTMKITGENMEPGYRPTGANK